ncbi:MAG: heparinase II/III family protein [Pseudomonadota bacterium]
MTIAGEGEQSAVAGRGSRESSGWDGKVDLKSRLAQIKNQPKPLLMASVAYELKKPFFFLPSLSGLLSSQRTTDLNFTPPDPWPGVASTGGDIMRGRLSFFGKAVEDPLPFWHPRGTSRDWQMALHGFDWLRDLRATGGDGARRTARALVASWIENEGQSWNRVSWKPEVLGRRLSSWLGQYEFFAASAELAFRQNLLRSLQRQADHLAWVLPAGLSGADVITAIKGLILAGCCHPRGKAWRSRGLTMLAKELPGQILTDGGHVERNPSQQLRVLKDLVDLRAALHAAGIEPPACLQDSIERMAPMLRLMRHGDGGLALFNGAAEEAGWQVDMVLQRCGGPKRPQTIAPELGFQRLQAGRCLILVDCGSPPAAGHDMRAHSGSLSFEMSLGRERLIVNCGAQVSHPAWRNVQRTTAAHSTVTVGETNSSELLPQGGLGSRRASVTAERSEDHGNLWLDLFHNGYAPLFGLRHHRRLYLAADGTDLRGEDRLELLSAAESEQNFTIRFHLHPDVRAGLTQAADSVLLQTESGDGWRMRAAGADISLEDSVYLGDGNTPRRSQQVVMTGHCDGPETTVKWALQRERRQRV